MVDSFQIGHLAEELRSGQPRHQKMDAVLIAGPTASGKSAFALAMAQAVDGEIVNADSMQVYADLRVLSARPNADEEATVQHHLFGFLPSDQWFSAGDYLRAVEPVLADIRLRGRVPILVGGTGLYFRALTEGLVETPTISPETQDRITVLKGKGEDLYAALKTVDPAMAERLNPADVPRVERALAVNMETGQSLASFWTEKNGAPLLAQGCWLGLFFAPDRDALYTRIDHRFEIMMQQGALDEVRKLVSGGHIGNRGVMKAHGVPHLVRALAGEISLPEAIQLGQQDTRNYAKRQFTWARRYMKDWRWGIPS
jgi:tRNA dimethylallyltransferase